MDLFGSAALVVGVHGAGLANALFCVEGAALLELSLPEPEFGEYAHLAGALGLHYASVPLPHSNFEARAWPKPSAVAAAAAALLDARRLLWLFLPLSLPSRLPAPRMVIAWAPPRTP